MIERLACPICGQSARVIFSRTYKLPELQQLLGSFAAPESLAATNYEVRFCTASAFCFQTWVMDAAEQAKWYSGYSNAGQFNRDISQQSLRSLSHLVEEVLVFRQVCAKPMPAVLDFGCQWGKWASVALALGCDVYGLDVNPEAAAFCRSRGIKMIQPPDLAGLQFDFINADQVFEHLAAPLSVARQLGRSLKPGGLLKISTPGDRSLPPLLEQAQRNGDNRLFAMRQLKALWPLEHVNLFTPQAIRELASRAGLKPFRVPLFKSLGAGQLWNIPRQANRNLVAPVKRWLGWGTHQWFSKQA